MLYCPGERPKGVWPSPPDKRDCLVATLLAMTEESRHLYYYG